VNYLFHILTFISIYSILALSLNLLVGYTGLLALCQAAFYGIGAYASVLFMTSAGMSFPLAVLLAMVTTAIISLAISVPSLRLKGDYFVLASLGFQMISFAVLRNWITVTNGPYGISGIPRPSLLGFEINSPGSYFIFSGIVALICAVLIYLLTASPFGRVLKAIREDEIATIALGKNTVRFKITAFAIAAAFSAIAGSLFAGYMRFIDPTSFTLTESVFVLTIIIVGGAGNVVGPLLGTLLLISFPEALRFLEIPDAVAGNVRQIIYGALIVVMLRWRPQGLWGEYEFE
jgi:branched-chain amino acid transport system permease protein